MTTEDKELLLKDLCARFPYGVKCADFRYDENGEKVATIDILETIYPNRQAYKYEGIPAIHHISRIKPYLRPISSMTEEERKEYKHLVAFSGSSYGAADLVDWLNKKMFAYRTIDGKDMFELCLAIEAPEGMYN